MINRIGGTRGPNGRSLEDIVQALDSLVLSMDAQTLASEQIVASINALALASAGQNAALLAALSAQADTSALATEQTLDVLHNSIGDARFTYPRTWTVRALLAQIAGNIDIFTAIDTPETTPANKNELLNADQGNCGALAWDYSARITDYNVLTTFTEGDIQYGVYAPIIPTVAQLVGNDGGGVAQYNNEWTIAHPGGFANVCFSWNFTDNVVYPRYARLLSDTLTHVQQHVYSVFDLTTTGSRNDTMRTGTGTEYISYRFAVPMEYGMPPNVFLHVLGAYPS